jgi:hypothetical protein
MDQNNTTPDNSQDEQDVKHEIKHFDAKTVDPMSSQRVRIYKAVFGNMRTHMSDQASITGVMLKGNAGTGKTSFARDLQAMLGIALVVIEAPHVTEEHLLNIPFIVFPDAEAKGKTLHDQHEKELDYELTLANSVLYTQLMRGKKQSDAQLLENIYENPKHASLIPVWEAFGGKPNVIPALFKSIRSKFSCLLFIDEYYRQPKKRIRNILRGLLNKQLGMHDMPAHVYTLYATNVDDEGVTTGDTNETFNWHTVEVPEKDEWFAHMVNKYAHTGELKDEVVQKFYNAIEQEHLSHNDMDNLQESVRSSPRRWEQILAYVSAALPVKDAHEAEQLIKNVRIQFRHYKTGQFGKLESIVADAVRELINETSGVTASSGGLSDDDWRETLDHQIKMKMRMGVTRKNIPVIAGLPGVGKTSELQKVADSNHMVLVMINSSNLSAEEIIGSPVTEKDKSQGLNVSFTKPPLLAYIEQQIKKNTATLMAAMTPEEQKKFKTQPYNILVFFDEFNRMKDVNAFNALRRVVLEKSFSDEFALPEKAMIVAAINPTGKSVNNLTSHMQDVIDVIPVNANWQKTTAYLDKMSIPTVDDDIKKTTVDAVKQLLENFESNEKPRSQRPFYPMLATGVDLFVSPRHVTTMVMNAANALQLVKEMHADDIESGDKARLEKVKNMMYDDFCQQVDAVMTDVYTQAGLTSSYDARKGELHSWIHAKVNLGEDLFYRKPEGADFKSTFEQYWDNLSDNKIVEDADVGNYWNITDPVTAKEQLSAFLHDKVYGMKDYHDFDDIIGKEDVDENGDSQEGNIVGPHDLAMQDKEGALRKMHHGSVPAGATLRTKPGVGRLLKFMQLVLLSIHAHDIGGAMPQTITETLNGFLDGITEQFESKSPEMEALMERMKDAPNNNAGQKKWFRTKYASVLKQFASNHSDMIVSYLNTNKTLTAHQHDDVGGADIGDEHHD